MVRLPGLERSVWLWVVHSDCWDQGHITSDPCGLITSRSLTHLVSRADPHLNPLSPRDALKHHFTSLKTDFIFLQLGVLEFP